MPGQIGSRKARASLNLEGFSAADLVHIKEEMDAFVHLCKETDRFHVQVSLSLNTSPKGGVRVMGEVARGLMEQYQEALSFKSIRELAEYLGVSRQTIYNWFHGVEISHVLFAKLIEKAPTQNLKERMQEFQVAL